jgi:5-aminolevulinate synthase
MATETHIIPLFVGNSDLCKKASDRLMEVHGIYIQPINFPTVPRGTERLRVTATPAHGEDLIIHLKDALLEVWQTLNIPYATDFTGQPLKQTA